MRTAPTIATAPQDRARGARVRRAGAPPDALDSALLGRSAPRAWTSSWSPPSSWRGPSSSQGPRLAVLFLRPSSSWRRPSSSQALSSSPPSSWREPASSLVLRAVDFLAVAFFLAGARLAVAFFFAAVFRGAAMLGASSAGGDCSGSGPWAVDVPSPGIARSMLLRGESNDSTTKERVSPTESSSLALFGGGSAMRRSGM